MTNTSAPKPTNPKDAVATNKMPLSLVSPIVKAYQAIAHFLGATKYGTANFAFGKVTASVYLDALERHVDKYKMGEWYDATDGTPHLANAQACLNILIEAHHRGTLVDNRPPSFDLAPIYAEFEALMPKLREKYKHLDPYHFTIADTPKASDAAVTLNVTVDAAMPAEAQGVIAKALVARRVVSQ